MMNTFSIRPARVQGEESCISYLVIAPLSSQDLSQHWLPEKVEPNDTSTAASDHLHNWRNIFEESERESLGGGRDSASFHVHFSGEVQSSGLEECFYEYRLDSELDDSLLTESSEQDVMLKR